MAPPANTARRPRFTLPGAMGRMRRPTLIILVYSVCMVLVGITATGQAGVITVGYQQAVLNAVVQDDAALIRTLVNSTIRLSDLPPDGPTADRRAELGATLDRLKWLSEPGVVGALLRAPDGSTVASTTGIATPDQAAGASIAAALRGEPKAAIVAGTPGGRPGEPAGKQLIREDLPLVVGNGQVRAVMTVWRDATPLFATIDALRFQVVLLTLTAAVVLAVILSFVFHRAQVRIHRGTAELVAAARRDPVTGLLNHGSVVDALAGLLLDARLDSRSMAVALVDIDNFRLLNETLGHDEGDRALKLVASRVIEVAPASAIIGRYGPDELLVFARGHTDDLVPALEAARAALAGISLESRDGEAIPVTFSAGLAESPGDAAGVTELLALAAQTLAAAKASGGDSLRTTADQSQAAGSAAFDVFEGLIIAIDTKDRYTKRHSEDVARYGLFIASCLDLDAEACRALRIAGLLHDVGKIGIPDGILRKPGRLSAEESRVVQQHVALGDMIVRDLPDSDVVRAGIRHHHERWDGKGYLHGLAGEEIPLIARILAVGDAFSAMTTTRPYRKAMSVREALLRLADAAGTQLDEDIVVAFVTGMERDPHAPLPGSPTAALWTPASLRSREAAA
jgi:diguanylate cyclase (GGDEF)-like protein